METMLISLFIATVMPILAKVPLAYAMHNLGGYNNRNPRGQQAKLSGFGARAKAAHENCFEALIMYAPGVLAILALDIPTEFAQYCAIAFVFSRFVYLMMYWIDQHLMRSIFWGVGFISSLLILWEAMIQTATVY
ncbi:MAPEG family protein [Alteromonas sp. a30]|uniref:MAPEG family protein n=1 Tax=Alteromonas sp. a30 TaxID=2730917 RepID=UPI0022801D3A|nr:MAPEG family protein [Alteromonas sp. a30]MCY7296146.1 MAPEG family protein [Alteromonas sp. a30]